MLPFLLPGSCFLFFLASCIPLTRPTLKIALVAPFEGRYRDVGYEVIYAVRLAVRQTNEAGGAAGYSVELLTLDDNGGPQQATAQARKAAADPQVLAVIGHWLEDTTRAAAPVYAGAGIPFLATSAAPDLPPESFRLWPTAAALESAAPDAVHCPAPCNSLENLDWLNAQSPVSNPRSPLVGPPLWGQPQFYRLAGAAAEGVYFVAPAPLPADSADPTFADRYRAVASPGVEPASLAVLAYDATRLLMEAIARDVNTNDGPTRAGTAAELARTDYAGLSGQFNFDSDHNWTEATGWVYQWREGEVVRP